MTETKTYFFIQVLDVQRISFGLGVICPSRGSFLPSWSSEELKDEVGGQVGVKEGGQFSSSHSSSQPSHILRLPSWKL